MRTLATNLGISALALVNSILLSRWLGPDGRGEVAAAMLWPTILVYLCSGGLISSTLYFTALAESNAEKVFANGMASAAIQSFVALTIGFITLPWLLYSQTSEVVNAARLYLLVIPLSLVTQYGVSILQGRMHIVVFNWLRLTIPLGYLIGTIIFILLGQLALFNIIKLHLYLNLLVCIGTLAVLLKSGIRLSLQVDLSFAKDMWKYGAKVHIGNVSGLANVSLDQVLLAAWLPPVYLGLYIAAVNAAGISQGFSQAVQMVLTPSIANKESMPERKSVLQGVFRRYWLFSLLITIATAAMLPIAIPLVFGRDFTGAVWPAEILLIGVFFIGAKEVLAGGAQALGNPWLGSKAQLWAVAVTITSLYVLLPWLGIMGAAIATSLAYATQLGIVISGLRRTHFISPVELFRFKFKDLGAALNVLSVIRGRRERLLSDQS